jgi:hypothetical protein
LLEGNDLNGRKQTHTGTRQFIRKDRPWHELVQGQWGCGQAFARAENPKNHFRSGKGRDCIQPYLEQRRIREPQDAATVLRNLTPEERIIEAMLCDFPGLAAQYGGVLEEAPSDLDNTETLERASSPVQSPRA